MCRMLALYFMSFFRVQFLMKSVWLFLFYMHELFLKEEKDGAHYAFLYTFLDYVK